MNMDRSLFSKDQSPVGEAKMCTLNCQTRGDRSDMSTEGEINVSCDKSVLMGDYIKYVLVELCCIGEVRAHERSKERKVCPGAETI